MLYHFFSGTSPLLIDVPHAGTDWPDELTTRPEGLAHSLPDTDWNVDRLVEAADIADSSALVARLSRYVIDLNRGPDDRPLYTTATTGLIPQQTFAGEPVHSGPGPDAAETALRIERYWRPYHDRLEQALEAIQQRHGHAVLIDMHSIRSRVPRLFEGRLPDLNLGTNDGQSCAPALEASVAELLGADQRFSLVSNARFKGGYITRHYGQPERGIHALQLEIAQACYLDEQHPEQWSLDRAEPLIRLLRQLFQHLSEWRP